MGMACRGHKQTEWHHSDSPPNSKNSCESFEKEDYVEEKDTCYRGRKGRGLSSFWRWFNGGFIALVNDDSFVVCGSRRLTEETIKFMRIDRRY